MPPFIDLTGKRFGRLIVLERDKDHVIPSGHHFPKWLCKCDCGVVTSVMGTSLRKGSTKSCGCLWKEDISGSNFMDLAGTRFGKLVVIRRSENYISPKGHICVQWECLCNCGNIAIVRTNKLRTGYTKSCGCLKESWIASEVKQYCSETYGAILEYNILRNPDTNHFLPYDIYIPRFHLFIEVNGEHHYRKTYLATLSSFSSKRTPDEEYDYRKKIDRLKKSYAMQNGSYITIDTRTLNSANKAIEYLEDRIHGSV